MVREGHGSLNGTYVNGEQVDETKLATGDEVQIGKFKLTFFAAENRSRRRMAGTRNYQSIGEVLVDVKTEFPDITISKIRFLESEGLITPERTPSGYRKFYVEDVERLKSILRLQRDEYLPLKVIKERLLKADTGDEEDSPPWSRPSAVRSRTAGPKTSRRRPRACRCPWRRCRRPRGSTETGSRSSKGSASCASTARRAAATTTATTTSSLSIVKDFLRFGIEPRHLTMYKHFAERESSFFEALVAPTLRQKNPDARRAATQTLGELTSTSRKFKQALLRNALREHLHAACDPRSAPASPRSSPSSWWR